jgi:hypothetical protein
MVSESDDVSAKSHARGVISEDFSFEAAREHSLGRSDRQGRQATTSNLTCLFPSQVSSRGRYARVEQSIFVDQTSA